MAELDEDRTVTRRTVELIVAALFMIVAAVVMFDSWRIGAGWNESGPQSGFFPFYIGLIMMIASTATFISQAGSRSAASPNFVERSRFWQVLQILLPTIVFVLLIDPLGLYVTAAIYLAFFMSVIGRYLIFYAVPAAAGVSVLLFLLFEKAFLIPLPKGPLEAALGY